MQFPMADKVKKEEDCNLNDTEPGTEKLVQSSFEAGDECAGVGILACKSTVQRSLGRWGGS